MTEEYTARPTIGRFVKTGVGDYFARLKYYDSEHRAILLLLVLCLFNIFTSVIATFAVGIYLLTRRDIAADIFRTGGNGLLFGFLALSVTLSAINCNIVGILACVFVFFIFIIALYIMQNITPRFFEDMISTFLGYSVFATAYAAVEYIIGRLGDSEYRSSSTFANPLYFSYFLTFAVLFCTYRIVTVKRYRRLYVPLLVINAFGMILSGGRMPWIGMFIGLFVILLLRRKYKLLFVFGAFISLLLLCFVCFPDIKIFAGLRLNKMDISYTGRMPYWDMAIKGIFDKPFFGHGMIGMLNDSMRSDTDFIKRFLEGGSLDSLFMNMKRHGWKMHAHNILLDALYSFGLIGTLMLFFYGIKKGLRFFRSCGYSSRDQYFALTCGVIVSIFVNGLIDCEIVGAQTAVFTFMFVGVMGIYEGETNADVLYKLEPKLTDDD